MKTGRFGMNFLIFSINSEIFIINCTVANHYQKHAKGGRNWSLLQRCRPPFLPLGDKKKGNREKRNPKVFSAPKARFFLKNKRVRRGIHWFLVPVYIWYSLLFILVFRFLFFWWFLFSRPPAFLPSKPGNAEVKINCGRPNDAPVLFITTPLLISDLPHTRAYRRGSIELLGRWFDWPQLSEIVVG